RYMAVAFAKQLPSAGYCLGSSHHDHPLPLQISSAFSCRPKIINLALKIGPRCPQQRSKISVFRPVAIEKGSHSPSAADSPEGGVDFDTSGKPEPFSSSTKENSDNKVHTLDLNLPRRSLLVSFTCDACSSRTKRVINRHAYERGTVFVQCAGCEAYHKLVDNLGLVVEYDFRDDLD
ncbi:hypothetical protein KI387_029200, partial [Taxus chinensis]